MCAPLKEMSVTLPEWLLYRNLFNLGAFNY